MSKRGAFSKATQRIKERRAERRERRHQKWASRFPFNLFNEMWRGITGNPR